MSTSLTAPSPERSGTSGGAGPGSGLPPPLPPSRPPQHAKPGLSRWLDRVAVLWDKASIYLPIFLMGFLALLSYWVVSLTPSYDLPQAERAVSQAPDSIMRDFAIRQFGPDGTLKSELFGREMRRYPYNDSIVIEQAQGLQIAETGRRTTFQAQRLTTNADQSIYWLEGQVIVVRDAHTTPTSDDPRVEYRGEALTLFVDEDRLESKLPVVITRGRDRISANSLDYDDNSTVAHLRGRVRALLAPRPAP